MEKHTPKRLSRARLLWARHNRAWADRHARHGAALNIFYALRHEPPMPIAAPELSAIPLDLRVVRFPARVAYGARDARKGGAVVGDTMPRALAMRHAGYRLNNPYR